MGGDLLRDRLIFIRSSRANQQIQYVSVWISGTGVCTGDTFQMDGLSLERWPDGTTFPPASSLTRLAST